MEFLLWILFFIKMIVLTFLSWPQILFTFLFIIIIVHSYYNYPDYVNNNNIFMNIIAYILNFFILSSLLLLRLWNWFKYTYIGNKIYRVLVYFENCYQLTKRNIFRNIFKRIINITSIRNVPRYSNDSIDTDSD